MSWQLFLLSVLGATFGWHFRRLTFMQRAAGLAVYFLLIIILVRNQ